MPKMVREYLDVADHSSLDAVIAMLTALRDTLPAGAQAEVRLRGDAVFGRTLSVCYDRPQSEAEAALDARYAPKLAAVPGEVASYERVEGEIGLAA
jgi:hypothetical protein